MFNLAVMFLSHILPSGSLHFLATSDDGQARDFDVETLTVCNNLSFPWAANVNLGLIFVTTHFYVNYAIPSIFTNLVLPFLLCFQHISLSPDRKLALVVGDSTYGLVVDAISGQVSKTKYSISLLISNSQFIVISCMFVSCRQSTLIADTRISPRHRHGTQITKHLPLETKT
jgi:hypothetical protein